MFKHKQLRTTVIQPALNLIGLYSLYAEELLIATCAIESYGGTYLVQSGSGPARGIYQMEPVTHAYLWQQIKKHQPLIKQRILAGCGYAKEPTADTLTINLLYASMMARMLYFIRIPNNFPKNIDPDKLWAHYKQYWNTSQGKSTKEHFLSAYYHFIGGHSAEKKV
jgi:hypothetical protein